jgi:hydrogenase maturation protease
MTAPRMLVACLGNIFLGDDGFGVEVAHHLQRRRWPADVRVTDFGIRGLDFIYALLDGYARVVLVDAVQRGQAGGTLYVIEPQPADAKTEAPVMDGHDVDPVTALAAARRLGAVPACVRLVGCEPVSLEPGIGLSPPVQAAVGKAVQLVEEMLGPSAWECRLPAEAQGHA